MFKAISSFMKFLADNREAVKTTVITVYQILSYIAKKLEERGSRQVHSC